MSDWRSALREDPIDWLLEEENPSVRYFALKDLLDKPEESPEVNQAKHLIMETGIVPELLAKQRDPSYLLDYPKYYTSKYKGLVWQLIVLAELGAGINEQINKQCEYLLSASQESDGGGFAVNTAVKKGGGRITEVIPCLTGNMAWCLLRFGYLDDPRLHKALHWLVCNTRCCDGVEDHPQVPPYDRYEICWGKHTCFMGVIKALKALSAVPLQKRTADMNDTIDKTSEFLLLHHIYKRSHDLMKTSKPGWLKLSFPLMYQTDVLEILDILTDLGISDSRMGEALQVILSKQDETGRWRNENTSITDQLLIPIGQKGRQDKWITLRAARVIKKASSLGMIL